MADSSWFDQFYSTVATTAADAWAGVKFGASYLFNPQDVPGDLLNAAGELVNTDRVAAAATNKPPVINQSLASAIDFANFPWTSEKLFVSTVGDVAKNTATAVSGTVGGIVGAYSAGKKAVDDFTAPSKTPSMPLWLKLTIGASLVLGVVVFVKEKA